MVSVFRPSPPPRTRDFAPGARCEIKNLEFARLRSIDLEWYRRW
jgi:hypothetical protein